jgi:hypothetical protein
MGVKILTNPIANVPSNPKSHSLGWAQVWQDQLNVIIDHKCTPKVLDADTVYIEHGANFGGTLNLFGGANKEVFDKINRVAASNNIVSLDWDMPDYGAMLKKRIGANTTYEGITEEWCDNLSKRLKNVPSLKQEDMTDYGPVTLGDSHSIAFSDYNHRVLRNDGKTLFGALKTGFEDLLRGCVPSETIHLCFGSIDIRHHILRHDNFDMASFIKQYVDQGKQLEDKYGVQAKYACPVPVEYENRRIPKTGFYKGTAFYGSVADRRDITFHFIDELYKQSNDSVIQPPVDWYHMDGMTYAKTYMELGGSFHIAPPFYYKNNWGQTCLA